ncbi:AMP-binding protein [bacterium]|jgi:crotonobetaine/carnitine-CoA ligase|nr:AMP-binding protein [bacterium]MBT3795430.1 AMP-binding protein [bacterium]MBT4634003.1 AMP-binding protein [bacterium]
MELLFKTRSEEFTGPGTLPNGSFDDTDKWQPMTKYLEAGALNFPDKAMFKIANGKGEVVETYTYKETNEKSNQVANGLIKLGVGKGDKVGMYMLNCAEFVLSILAIHKTGGIQVPINKDEKGERLAYIINYSDQVALVVDDSGLPLIEDIADKLENLKTIYVTGDAANVPNKIGDIPCEPFNKLYEGSNENPNVDVGIDDKERCMFTSGTTGMPKGVVREHGGVVLTVRAYLQQQGIRNDDVLMSVLSLGHANAQAMCLFTSIGAGATAVFFPKFSASNFFRWAHDCGATCVNMLGAVAEYLWSAKPSEYDQKHNIRIMLGSPAPRNLIEFQKRFNLRVIDGYGSTEMGMVLWKNPEDQRDRSMGYPTEGFYVELRNPENIEEVVRPHWDPYVDDTPPDSAKGILYIRPLVPNTTLNEYFKDERRTREAFDDDGFFNSDDVMACGIDGRYYFIGRHTRLRVSGENVDPIAVADLALMHPAVQDAIAVGLRLPDVSDDELKLNVIVKDGEKFDEAEFCTWMAEQCIVAMVPRFIEVFEGGYPMTATQKVKVAELKEISDKTWDRAKAGLKFSSRK